jgi:dipeptidyl aminopeptidase/acylaminoacyl peptidase
VKSLALVLTLFALAGCATLVGLAPVALPEYDSDRGIQHAGTREDYDAARADPRFILRQFTYVSDGVTVGAYLYGAPAAGGKPQPVIVFNRGSFTRPDGFAGEMLAMAHRFAEAGFIVVAPHYRGSNGWAGRDEIGGGDLRDLMNVAPELSRIPGADVSRVFLAGESRGGGMVYMALRDGFPARAAAVWGAFTDLEPLVAPGGPQAKAVPFIWPDFEQRREEIIRSRSALRWAEKINVPVLIMHGGADEQIPLSQSQRMDAELTRLRKVHELKVFDGEKHIIAGHAVDRDAAVVAWFTRFGARLGGSR